MNGPTSLSSLLVQSDGTLLLDERLPGFEETRELLRPFAELLKQPGPLHTYKLSSVTLWNAATAGWTSDGILEVIRARAKYGVPANLAQFIALAMSRYGQLRLIRRGDILVLVSSSPEFLKQAAGWRQVADCF